MKRIISLFLLFFVYSFVFSQAQQEFWFAAPEVTARHGDAPIELWLTSFEEDVDVEIAIPSNLALGSKRISLPQNSLQVVDITDWLFYLENDPPGVVHNKGLYIRASALVTVQYVVVGSLFNRDVFNLKGSNALGIDFVVPFQDKYDQQERDSQSFGQSLEAYSSIDMVAIEDDTEVEVVLANPANGKAKGDTLRFVLNKGQSYSVRADGFLAAEHLGGTQITSTKKIAVTIKDDSVLKGNNWDLIGDQIVPTQFFGTRYITQQGDFFVVAEEDDTEIMYQSISYSLDRGEQVSFTQTTAFEEITSNKAIGILQLVEVLGAQGSELAGGILGPWNCHRSSELSFFTTADDEFDLYLVADTSAVSGFELDGLPVDLRPYFNPVPGTELGAARIAAVTDLALSTNSAHELTNALGDFTMSFKYGSETTGAAFSYLSSYGFVSLSDTLTFCDDKQAIISAGNGKQNYLWNTGETTPSIEVNTPGKYYVDVKHNGCLASDTIVVEFVQGIDLQLQDTILCEGMSLKLDFDPTWDVELNRRFVSGKIDLDRPGTNNIKVTSADGCYAEASFRLSFIGSPEIDLGADTILCNGGVLTLGEYRGGVNYEWNTGSNEAQIKVNQKGEFALKSYNHCGVFSDTISVDFWEVQVPNVFTPNNDGVNDAFEIKTNHLQGWSFNLINRWGDEVYSTPNYQNEFNAEGLSDGLYYYQLGVDEATCTQSQGWLYIVR